MDDAERIKQLEAEVEHLQFIEASWIALKSELKYTSRAKQEALAQVAWEEGKNDTQKDPP